MSENDPISRSASWIQPIFVSEFGSHVDAVASVARSSLGAWSAKPRWGPPFGRGHFEEWLAASMPMTIRFASNYEIAALGMWAAGNDLAYSRFHGNDVRGVFTDVLSFAPMRHDDIPDRISQVGTPHGPDLARDLHISSAHPQPVAIAVNDELATPTAAQIVTRVLWKWALPFTRSGNAHMAARFERWAEFGLPFTVSMHRPETIAVFSTYPNSEPVHGASGLTAVVSSYGLDDIEEFDPCD